MRPSISAGVLAGVFAIAGVHSTAFAPITFADIRRGVCEREGGKLVGERPVQIDAKTRMPRRLRHIGPRYPELPPKTVGSGNWLGEALIDRTGKVARVWTIRAVRFTPPFPAFNDAITRAISQWEYQALVVNGRAVPFCTTVIVSINWS